MLKLVILILSFACAAKDRLVKYNGIAKKDGKIVYYEQHEEVYEDDRLLRARTFYRDHQKTHFATERNEFPTEDYAFPISKIIYPGTNIYEGSKIEANKYVIYRKLKDSPHEDEVYDMDGLTITGQGIHHYLANHLEKVKLSKTLTFRYLIPARLTHYTFRYTFLKEKKGLYHIRVEIDSWFLRLVAPHFDAVYDPRKKRIVSYKGLSNWKDKDGDLQKVEITYEYED